MAGFVPPPAPGLAPEEIAAIYRGDADMVRTGMILGLFGIAGYAALVGADIGRNQARSRGRQTLGAQHLDVRNAVFEIGFRARHETEAAVKRAQIGLRTDPDAASPI